MYKMCTFLLSKFALVFVLIVSSLHSITTARGGEHKETPGRRLLDDHESKPSAELAKGYMSNAELENAIMAFGERCSNISRIYSIGKSVAGVPLWVMEISDHPGREEPEPAFKFIGNVHGDEPVGRELLMLLANWLCDNYMKDPLAKLVVENVHLHLLPSMNPDGYALRKRGNANNVDLNRDFPDQFFSVNDVEDTRQPETIAIMRWLRRIQFTASATLHGIPTIWEYNRMSMLNLVATVVKTGVHGRILSSDNGKPLAASIMIEGINHTIKARAGIADYHRLLVPGMKYEVKASMPGYKSKSTTIMLDEVTTLDFILEPEAFRTGKVVKTACDCSENSKGSLEMVDILAHPQLEVSLVVIVTLEFLLLSLRRKLCSYLPKQRQLPVSKRPTIV